MTYFLAERDRRFFERRALWSACADEPREGYVRLFNKNALSTLFVRIVDQCADRYGWLVECESVPDYFLYVLIEVAA